jgi:hypothetical protein
MPKHIQAGVPQDSVLFPTLYSIYIQDMPQTPGVFLGRFADDTRIGICDRPQRGLHSQKVAVRSQCY